MAAPVARTCSTARRLIVGSAPGSPRQTGQTWVFGGAPSYVVEQPQNIFEAVRSWQWTSMPMTASYRSRAEAAAGVDVAGAVMTASFAWAAVGTRAWRQLCDRA